MFDVYRRKQKLEEQQDTSSHRTTSSNAQRRKQVNMMDTATAAGEEAVMLLRSVRPGLCELVAKGSVAVTRWKHVVNHSRCGRVCRKSFWVAQDTLENCDHPSASCSDENSDMVDSAANKIRISCCDDINNQQVDHEKRLASKANMDQQSAVISQLISRLDQLEEINSAAFCFYRVLRPEDRGPFLTHYVHELASLVRREDGLDQYVSALAYLRQGGVVLKAWLRVMKACEEAGCLHNDYVMYRKTSAGLEVTCQFKRALESRDRHNVKILLSENHLELLSGDENLPSATKEAAEIVRDVRLDIKFPHGSHKHKIRRMFPVENNRAASLLVFGNSIPSADEHAALVREFQGSAVVARFKNFDSKNNPVLEVAVLQDIFTTLKTQLPSRFSYFHCLHRDDQAVFEQQLMLAFQDEANNAGKPLEEVLARVASGGVTMAMWQDVMDRSASQGLFTHQYVLYRRAYWGENSNEFSDNTLYSFYHCVVRKFEVNPANRSTGTIAILFDGYGHLSQLSSWFLNPSQNADPNRHLPPDLVIY
jgi:hypothetical protein